MGKVIIEDSGEEYTVQDGESIAEVCEEAGVPFACTEGVCGTCVVEVKEGMDNLTEFTQEEEDFLGPMECERLACQCKLKSGNVKLSF
jgi:ferredoxin